LSNLGPLFQVIERVRRMFDVGADPLQITQHLSRSSRLNPLVEKRPGLRVPGVWDGFEFAVLSILDVQLTARNPARVIGNLVKTFGTPLKGSVPGLNHLFPQPEQLADADLSIVEIRGGCAKAIRSLARTVLEKRLTFDTSRSLEDARSRLCAVRGLGERERDYIAMRVFGEPDAFPPWDHVLRRAVSADGMPVTPAELLGISEPWRPWRAYAAMHLWVAGAEVSGRRRN
jgi:AraC family transcriptional regulator, regulatory protein of adaptative response / DNA-3-methyladenine glycosylase II